MKYNIIKEKLNIYNYRKIKINEDIMIYLLINNKIIYNNLISGLLDVFNNLDGDIIFKYLFLFIEYIWLCKNKLKENIKLKNINNNVINNLFYNHSLNINISMFKNIKKIFIYLKYIPNLIELHIPSININNSFGNNELKILCNNLHYILNLKELDISSIFNIF